MIHICVRDTGFVWYSTAPDERLRGRLIVLDHCLEPTYGNMTYRMIEIWSHVWHHWHGYSWYMRLWDDNWVDVHRMLRAAMIRHDLTDSRGYSELALFGRLGGSPVYPGHLYAGGGAGSFLSGAAARAWMGHPSSLAGITACLNFVEPLAPEFRFAEDVHLTECQLQVGVKLFLVPGLSAYGFGVPTEMEPWNKVTPDDIRCRRPFQEVPQEMPSPFITMHYMREAQLLRIRDILRDPCPSNQ